MASLREVKDRIASVRSTQKITSAMQMVAGAKLRRAQSQIESFLPYQTRLMGILNDYLSSEAEFTTPLAEEREIKSVALVVISSNSSFCGAFNSNVIKLFKERYVEYRETLPADKIKVYAIGKKVELAAKKVGVQLEGSYQSFINRPTFEEARKMADELMDLFLKKEIDKVEILYNHFKGMGSQVLTNDQFLPINLSFNNTPQIKSKSTRKGETKQEVAKAAATVEYIIEPDRATLLAELLPKSQRSKIFSAALDSAAAEQAARSMAMQIATDNAEELVGELTIQLNKQRQQAITNELLDIVSGAEALR